MKTAKQEAIEKAYHELGFTGLYNQADSNGWVNVKPQQFTEDIFDRLKFNSNKHSIRPKSLKGIETNNGWIRIESEEDLPKDAGYCDCIIDGELSEVCFYWESEQSFTDASGHMIKPSHYIMKTKPNPHIY